jgi:excisionase family DNA binding protein
MGNYSPFPPLYRGRPVLNIHQVSQYSIQGANPMSVKKDKLKDILKQILQHIQRTNEFLGSLIPMIENMEKAALSPPIIAKVKNNSGFLSVDKAVQFTGYSRSYIYKLTHSNQIPFYKPTNGRLFFRQSELEDFLLRNKRAANYEISNKANEILNSRETNRVHSRRKNQGGKK